MDNELSLQAKNDIPFPEAQLTIHQPSIKEIGLIGEENFLIGCQFLTISKDRIQDKTGLENQSDFDILMSIAQDKNPMSQRNKICAEELLVLLFPKYKINFLPRSIAFVDMSGEKPIVHQIDSSTFEKFKDLLQDMFMLKILFREGGEYDIDEDNILAKRLRDKFDEYHKKLAKMKNKEDGQNSSIFSRYISILAVGEEKDKNTLLEYSVFQLMDEFQRYQAKQEFDIYIQAKMAGAKDLKEVQNWMGDLNHPDK